MAFACCESCGSTSHNAGVLRYGEPAGPCPHCSGRMVWMATPFAQRLLERRRLDPEALSALHVPWNRPTA